MPNIKSKYAFQFSVQMMVPEIYFWTFTNPTVEDIDVTIKRWTAFQRRLIKCFPLVSGLRVFEMHKTHWDGYCHGLHVHALFNIFLPVNIVRRLFEDLGGGRINVKKVAQGTGLYLAKYLGKDRADCLAGKRLWACVGKPEHSHAKDIVVESKWTEAYKFLSCIIVGFSALDWVTRLNITTLFVSGKTIEDAMGGAGLQSADRDEPPIPSPSEIKWRDTRRKVIAEQDMEESERYAQELADRDELWEEQKRERTKQINA